MRIALVGPIDTPITKDSTAGTEIWTYNFAEALLKKGIEVTLFASEGSEFSGSLETVVSREDILNEKKEISPPSFSLFSVKEMAKVVKEQDKFDLIHISVYSFQFLLPLVDLITKPVAITLHGTPFPDNEMGKIMNLFPAVNYIFISKQFETKWAPPQKHQVIYNGIRVDQFEFNDQKSDYYFWMSRISPEKGVEDAIEFAKRSNSKLIIAGSIRNKEYYDKVVAPNLNEKIKYAGEVDFKAKNEYYKNAKAFLMPIKWDEPFGLVVVEALACGTPVIAYNRGAMPEILEDGKNGFLVKPGDIDGLIESSSKLETIKSEDCRKSAEKFSLETMANSYLKFYKELTK